MRKNCSYLLTSLVLLLFSACNSEPKTSATEMSHRQVTSQSVHGQDDFAEFKKDEACDSKEELEKELVKIQEKKKAFKLQGGDAGCDIPQ